MEHGHAKRGRSLSDSASENADRLGESNKLAGDESASYIAQDGPAKKAAGAALVSYRLLCPALKIGNVIGKGGSVISILRQESGAKIKVDAELPGCAERLVILASPDDPPEVPLCRAQQALLAVHARMADADAASIAAQEGDILAVRLLVEGAQVGAVLGRAGQAISEVRRSSGAHVRVSDARKDAAELPPFAQPDDALITVKGESGQVREALQQLSALIREHLQRKPQQQRAPVFNITAVATGAMQRWPPPPDQAGQRGPPLREAALPPHMQQPDQAPLLDVQFRLLVPASHIGGVIGRKGDVIQSIRDATGAHIRAHEGSSERKGADRVISVASREREGTPSSAAQEALALIVLCLLEPKGALPVPLIRALVPTTQVGAVLGSGGAAIGRVRADSGASVRLVPMDLEEERALPRDVAATPAKVLVVEGTPPSAVAAIRGVAAIMRAAQAEAQGARPCRERSGHRDLLLPSARSNAAPICIADPWPDRHRHDERSAELYAPLHVPHARHLPPADFRPLDGPYGAPPNPPALHCNQRAEYLARELKRELYGLPRAEAPYEPLPVRHGSPDVRSRRPPLERPLPLRSRHSLNLPGHAGHGVGAEHSRPALPAPHASGDREEARELLLAGAQVGAVLGKAGDNISQIRKISGARVKLSDAPRGVSERRLRLSGQPQQVQAAINLVQAFLLAGNAGSLEIAPPMQYR